MEDKYPDLTKKQERLFLFYTDINNWRMLPPTLVQCKQAMGVSADASILKMMDIVKRKGYDPSQPRDPHE